MILTNEKWGKIEGLLPKASGRGRPRKEDRRIIEGIFWVHRTGSPWRDLPKAFGPWQSVYTRFNRWTRKGIWQEILEALKKRER